MTSKSGKGKSPGKTDAASGKASAKKAEPTPKKQSEDGIDDEEIVDEETELKPAGKKGGKAAAGSKKSKDEDEEGDEDAVDEPPDEWEKPAEEEEWDPDFEEFDIPKSKIKKTGNGVKKGAEEEEDFKFEDEEFKDLFGEKNYDDDEEDDY